MFGILDIKIKACLNKLEILELREEFVSISYEELDYRMLVC